MHALSDLSLDPDEMGTSSSVPGNIPDKPFYSRSNDEEETEPSRASYTFTILYPLAHIMHS